MDGLAPDANATEIISPINAYAKSLNIINAAFFLCFNPDFFLAKLMAISLPPMMPKNTHVVLSGIVLMNSL